MNHERFAQKWNLHIHFSDLIGSRPSCPTVVPLASMREDSGVLQSTDNRGSHHGKRANLAHDQATAAVGA